MIEQAMVALRTISGVTGNADDLAQSLRDGSWTTEDSPETVRPDSVRQMIRLWLRQHPVLKEFAVVEACAVHHNIPSHAVGRALLWMEKRGELERVRRGVYRAARLQPDGPEPLAERQTTGAV